MMVDKILVLDDEENYAEMLQAVLEEHYFLTDVESDPARALRALEQHGYKVVVSDYRMPVMDGADFLVKARAVDPDLPIILVSGLMNTPELLKVANLGVTLVFEKPVDVGTFLEAIRRYATPLSASDFYRYQRGKTGEAEEAADASEGTKAPARITADFPKPLHHVIAHSAPMVVFLNRLWSSLREQSHVFVSTPGGSEIELVMREATRWQHQEDRSAHFLLAHRPPASLPEWLSELPEATSFGHTVGVVGYQLASHEQQEALVDCIREAPEEVTFVHFFNANLLELASHRVHPELLELLRENLCGLPALHQRPSDLVGYLMRYLPQLAKREGKAACSTLHEEAFAALLAHRWPLNFAELLGVLRRAVHLAEEGAITRATLEAALRRHSGEGAVPEATSLDLAGWLLRRQRDLLSARLPAFGNDLGEVLRAANAPTEVLQQQPTLDGLDLLFPDLLEASASA